MEIHAAHFDGSRGGQCPIHAWSDAGGDVLDLGRATGARRVLDEEVQVDGKIADRLFQPGRMLFTSLETLSIEFPQKASVLPGVRAQSDAEIDIEGGRTRQAAVLGEVAAKVFGHEATDEHEIGVP